MFTNLYRNNAQYWQKLLTLAICVVGGIALPIALALEWQAAPEWLSPRALFAWKQLGFVGGWGSVGLAGCLAAAVLLMGRRRGRILLRVTAVVLALLLLPTLVRWQTALAYAGLGFVLILAGGIGHRILRALCPKLQATSLERLLLALPLGYGTLSFVAFALAATHALHVGVIVAVLALLAFLFYRESRQLFADLLAEIRSNLAAMRQTDLRRVALVVGLLGICAYLALLRALANEIEYDSMMYHLAIPQIYASNGGVVEIPQSPHSHFCHGVEMLYTVALAIAGQPLPQLLHFSAGLMVLGLVFCLARRVAGSTAGWLAALGFYALPMIGWESGHAMSDLFTTLYVFAAMYAAVLWIDLGDNSLLGLAGCLAGLAVGAKLNTLLFIVPLEALLLCRVVFAGAGRKERFLGFLLGGFATVALAAPWLVWEWLRTGNPVFPFYNGFFQSPLWVAKNENMDFDLFGLGHGISYFLRLPWDLTASSGRFGQPSASGALEALPLVCVPFTVLLWPRRFWKLLWLPMGVLLGGGLLWFSQVQYVRYLLPVVPVMVLLAAVNAVVLWTAFATTPRRKAWLSGLVLVLGICWFADTRWWRPERDPFALVYGLESSDAYLTRVLPEYAALRYLAEEGKRRPTRVLTYPCHCCLYGGSCTFYHRTITVRTPELLLGTQRVPIEDARQVAKALSAMSVDYLLLNVNKQVDVEEFESLLFHPPFLTRHCRLVMAHEGLYDHWAYLYRLVPETEDSSDPTAPDPKWSPDSAPPDAASSE